LRQHTLSQREIELDGLLRSRERTVKELEEHLRAAFSRVTKRVVTITTLEARLTRASNEVDAYRQRLANIVQRAVTDRHRDTCKRQVNRKQKNGASVRRKTKNSVSKRR
jgi:hypothetical protein